MVSIFARGNQGRSFPLGRYILFSSVLKIVLDFPVTPPSDKLNMNFPPK